MKKLSLLVIALCFAATSAFAFRCPTIMRKFDESVKTTKASAQQVTEAKKLREEGEKLHKAGKHQDSIDALNKALALIGVAAM